MHTRHKKAALRGGARDFLDVLDLSGDASSVFHDATRDHEVIDLLGCTVENSRDRAGTVAIHSEIPLLGDVGDRSRPGPGKERNGTGRRRICRSVDESSSCKRAALIDGPCPECLREIRAKRRDHGPGSLNAGDGKAIVVVFPLGGRRTWNYNENERQPDEQLFGVEHDFPPPCDMR